MIVKATIIPYRMLGSPLLLKKIGYVYMHVTCTPPHLGILT